MAENRKRPCEFTDSNKNKLKGLFHQWGSEAFETSENMVQHTVGLVEDENGKIHGVDPGRIKFTDR